MTAEHLGIDIGSTNIKVCLLENGQIKQHAILTHEGNIVQSTEKLFEQLGVDLSNSQVKALVTGTEARHRLKLPEAIAPMAIEKGLKELKLAPQAAVSMGGEDLVVYPLSKDGRITSTLAGNKCASGTGEFFRQQLGRMNLDLTDFEQATIGAAACQLSARCSVFMKSDCTHRLNKGEASTGDIALSLSKVMADKVSDFLTKARIDTGQVVLLGGVTQNKPMVDFIKKTWPNIEFIVPKQSPYFEAYGAALLAKKIGQTLPTNLFSSKQTNSFETFPPFNEKENSVHYVTPVRGAYDPNADYILGVDGGSTTTKAALINSSTKEIVAEHYGRTHGDPVNALKLCIQEIKKQINNAKPKISLVSTTGSSRELLGVFLETEAVYNEIIAHTVGTTYFENHVDTIFEIGGQDAKYVSINNAVPIDYAMNEACSAGTGSFLEESARGDLNINEAKDIGPIALTAEAPLKYGEHCSAFINSDIRKSISQGATRENIVAGLIFSVVANYLNRVVGNRRIGDHIVLQGGVAKNKAIPLAFAQMTGKKITVPPDPELMGCFGVALLCKQKQAEGRVESQNYDLDEILNREIATKGTFTCKSCDNYCEIRRLEVQGRKYPFGGRCSKFTNARKKKHIDKENTTDYIQVRKQMLFVEHAPNPDDFIPRTEKIVGVPKAFSVHSLWPFYSWFFHSLGIKLVLSDAVDPEGMANLESNYCYPVEIAHGAIHNILKKNPDFIFMPFFKDMPSNEKAPVHATVCPLTQGFPFFGKQAFDLKDEQILKPLVSFKKGWQSSKPQFVEIAERFGFSKKEGEAAYEKGIFAYRQFLSEYKALGRKVIERIKADPDTVYVALLGRPYNAFTRDANMGIPRKFISKGVTLVPFDMIYDPQADIFPNMYWYYGQQDMKAVRKVAELPNFYLTWITNFSCAPDSFMLHYLRWMMGQKPYLVLEIDSHSADAGVDTRIEAFLDIVDSYRRSDVQSVEIKRKKRYEIKRKKEFIDIVDNTTGEHIDVRDSRVKFIWNSMGDLSTEAISAAATRVGINSIHLPVPTVQTTQLARNVASGKECIPSLIVLGSMLQFLQDNEPNKENEIYLFFMPSTLGPCRTGQYHVFYERLFDELGYENVLILIGDSSNSYREMGPTFNRDIWWALVLGDYFTDARCGLRLLAKNVDEALEVFDLTWANVIEAVKTNGNIDAALAQAGKALSTIPRKRSLEELRRVLIVGEIFVRRDTFSVAEINDFLISKDIFPKVTGVTEWIGYTDHCRWREMEKSKKANGLLGSLSKGILKKKAWYNIEAFYKSMVDHKVARHLKPTGLIPDVPHNMHEIVGHSEKLFIDPNLESEATCSAGVAAAGMLDGYSGIAIIAPFACLPCRLIEGVYMPWARNNDYPTIALENDGQPYPPNVLARMEIFAHNVARHKKS